MSTLPSFAPPRSPSINGTQLITTPRMRRVKYGDGYSQRQADGINIFPHTATLKWETLAYADAQAIDAFFIALGASGAFLYAHPGDQTTRKWTVTTWTRPQVGYAYQSLQAELTEEFDP
ncbi:MAG: phage tail protein [Rhodoplanes sp.]|uniref:phage tail protein n=1 Tax=Rhodoplanes sp. TaxID=1968906 RepID=UPI0018128293|nr:phage tail protein [Rhodoplanes sp.]NVO13905.1 phage tail protein [Rhodoplanes sp.]